MTPTSFRSHLTTLETSSSLFASRSAFRIPLLTATGDVEYWKAITYKEFYNDVERVARYWAKTLRMANIPSTAVVSVWLSGWLYSDVVQIYGLSRAGYIPQVLTWTRLSSDLGFELLKKANAQVLIYDPSFPANLDQSPVPRYKSADIECLCSGDDESLPKLTSMVPGGDIAPILHTSGSTSDSPKIVPCSYKWLDMLARKSEHIARPRDPNRPEVNTWMGSACHIGQTRLFLGSFQHGSCTVLPTQKAFSAEELADLVERCGLNVLHQFPTYLGMHLRNSYSNPELLGLLQSLDEVRYSAMPLGKEAESWAYKNGILLKNTFGNTECGPMMISIRGRGSNASLLRPLGGVSYAFVQAHPMSKAHLEITGAVVELVVLSNSADCPDISLRSPIDGHFHTGHLFEEVAPGYYVSRGRDDDWIKCESASLCNTKSIEDNVRSACSDLVAECVAVGNRRPSPALFIEPARDDIDPVEIKEQILQRTRSFHARRYTHERISSVHMIIVVDRGTLPRTITKGNVRRRAVEEAFKRKLDEAYSKV